MAQRSKAQCPVALPSHVAPSPSHSLSLTLAAEGASANGDGDSDPTDRDPARRGPGDGSYCVTDSPLVVRWPVIEYWAVIRTHGTDSDTAGSGWAAAAGV